MIKNLARLWARLVTRFALVVLAVSVLLTVMGLRGTMQLKVSTSVEALMPEGASSVISLNRVLEKTGSYASVQIVIKTSDPNLTLETLKSIQSVIDGYDWVGSSQYQEDIQIFEQHKLLLLSTEELLQLEADINAAIPATVAKKLSDSLGPEISINIRDEDLHGSSSDVLDTSRIDKLKAAMDGPKQTSRNFVSEDGLTGVLIVWPKPGYDSLTVSRRMIVDSKAVLRQVISNNSGDYLIAAVGGRIASQVGQFDAIINDLKLGLLSSVFLIALLIIWSYRSPIAIPAIFIPLAMSIIWTMGLTAETIGNLNLITVFLSLILFGLGIDYGIHNFSRYREERRKGASCQQAIETIIVHTGAASLIATLTTSLGFYALMLTDFRAFTEFGFIAGSGILLAFLSMYTVLPALLVILENLGWRPDKLPKSHGLRMQRGQDMNPLRYKRQIISATCIAIIFATIFAPRLPFEQNIKNLEARESAEFVAAKQAAKAVLGGNNSRAIMVVETEEELRQLHDYFDRKMATDTETPTIRKVTSIVNLIPPEELQHKRLEVIRRLEKRAEDLKAVDPARFDQSRPYLTIGELKAADLPPVLRRTYIGMDNKPGYLLYIDNSVNVNDRRLANQFYDDAARVQIGDKVYHSASQDFIFVEMLAMMKQDSLKAVILVILTTTFVVFIFVRSLIGSLIVLSSPLIGIFITIGIMGAFGPALSIMNMVVLPSIIGIAVDNSIHIYHRYIMDPKGEDIARVMNTTGRASILTTLTTLIGYGGMITASMGGLKTMAVLAIIGFTTCLLLTWFLLPVLLDYYKRYLANRTYSF